MSGVSYFYIYKDTAAEWRWRFTAKNGKTIAVSSEGYNNLVDCEHAVGLMKAESPTAPIIGDDDYDRLRK
ncbi:YegP family protein [Pseudomonas chlororaphis]|uniref:YegP family protein n=1 Tax=Pseudomonas chlororaphis TaxID=587753 RepID=UPI0003653D88|nr:DUF1508 domain-containing protein [Pseudomonas chlororaphis]